MRFSPFILPSSLALFPQSNPVSFVLRFFIRSVFGVSLEHAISFFLQVYRTKNPPCWIEPGLG